MKVQCVWSSGPRHTEVLEWECDPGTTVAQALARLPSLLSDGAAFASQDQQAAIWGQPVDASHVLQDGDRLEWLRPLQVDPKVARRERFKRQGAKTAGLFAQRRQGAKAGY